MKPIILGSQSPRRKEILGYFSLPFEQANSDFDEEAVPYMAPPQNYAASLSRGKALALTAKFPEQWILTADTIVFCENKVFGKPKTLEEAHSFLQHLQGRWHSVFSAVTVCKGNQEFTEVEETRVLFNELTRDQIQKYHEKTLWNDKSGGYTIQMAGGMIVNKIDGCYYNVTGLPVNTVRKLLLCAGIDLWDYLK